jgi:hypothetical protein
MKLSDLSRGIKKQGNSIEVGLIQDGVSLSIQIPQLLMLTQNDLDSFVLQLTIESPDQLMEFISTLWKAGASVWQDSLYFHEIGVNDASFDNDFNEEISP